MGHGIATVPGCFDNLDGSYHVFAVPIMVGQPSQRVRPGRTGCYGVSVAAIDSSIPALLTERVAAACEQAQANLESLEALTLRLRHTRQISAEGRDRRAALHELAYARLEAKLATMPTIEQAKGILMERAGCGPDEAFGLLRAASQRANVKVRDLAAAIVAAASATSL